MVFKIIQISNDCLINWILMNFVGFSSEILTRKSISWRHEICWDCFSLKSLLSLSYLFFLLSSPFSLSLSLSLSLLSFLPSLSPFSLHLLSFLPSLYLSLSSLPPFSLPLSISHKKIKNKSMYWEYYDRKCVVIISLSLSSLLPLYLS